MTISSDTSITNETTSAGITEPDSDGKITALTPAASKQFSAGTRGRSAAIRWLAARGYAPDGSRLTGVDVEQPPPAPPPPTREAFVAKYRELMSALPWAVADAQKLERYMATVERALGQGNGNWSPSGQELAAAAWKAIGGKGRVTMKALRALPRASTDAAPDADVCLAIVLLDQAGDGGPGIILKTPATFQDWQATAPADGTARDPRMLLRSNRDRLPEGARVAVAPSAAGATPVAPAPGPIGIGTCVRLAAFSDENTTIGVVRQLVEPEPGWDRALVRWPDATEQFVDLDKLRAAAPAPEPVAPAADPTPDPREGAGVLDAATLAADDGDQQQPDPRPGFYYVTCRNDAGEHAFVRGPWVNDHAGALAAVRVVRQEGERADPKSVWYAWGTARREVDNVKPVLGGPVDPDGNAIEAPPAAPPPEPVATRTTVTPIGDKLLWVTVGDAPAWTPGTPSRKYPDGYRNPLDKSPASNVPEPGEDVSRWHCPPMAAQPREPSTAEPPDVDGSRGTAIPVLPEVPDPTPAAVAGELARVRADLAQADPITAAACEASGVDVLMATSNARLRDQAAALTEQLARPLVLEADGTTRPATSIWDETTAATLLAPDGHVIKSRFGRTCAPGTCGDQCQAAAPLESPRPAPTDPGPALEIRSWSRRAETGDVCALVALADTAAPDTTEERDRQRTAIERALMTRDAAWRLYCWLVADPEAHAYLRRRLRDIEAALGPMFVPTPVDRQTSAA